VIHNALEQVRLADELGFDQTWVVEHHFLEEYSHSSAPDLFLTACAMQTERMRLGHGIVTCVPEINNPIRIAERTAFLDVLSRGRVEVGTGRSATWTELGGFGADPDSTKRSWDEFVRIIPKMWTQDRFSYQGEYFSMPERSILPKPVQQPHPPLWLAVTSPGTEIDAADRGLGALSLTFGGMKKQTERFATYRKRIQYCEPVGHFVNEQINCVNFLFCHEDGGYAKRVGERMATAFSSSAAQFMEIKESYPSANYLTPGLLSGIRRDVENPGRPKGVPEGLTYGEPDRVTGIVKQWEEAGADRILFLLNALETVPQAEVLESMRLFAREVMPRFTTAGDRAALEVSA
jgi:alkanesulfonate monooxygenase SsuD/methylene tetrahydromethanopterin reductase-like flavin-dependent oxidoreductase (luciferase family)